MTWNSSEEYETIHGTQEEQAARQASGIVVDGPWRLESINGPRIVLDNSVRSTSREAARLLQEEARKGRDWMMVHERAWT